MQSLLFTRLFIVNETFVSVSLTHGSGPDMDCGLECGGFTERRTSKILISMAPRAGD